MFPPGTQLGRYTVSHRLGSGGMGDVYLARDTTLDRMVAVKVLPEAVAANAERLGRFLREAKAASALNHPNILTVHDFGQQDATRFLVTEFVDGQTLRDWVEEADPPLSEILGVVAQAASALAAAHAAGVVHRDVKPENLMLRRDGLVKVLDFGIAKLTGPAGPASETLTGTDPGAHTMPGTVLGTIRYMSPEQASGEAVDARADVWSLGVVLYELLAGKPPFSAETPMGVLGAILSRDPEPLDVAAPWVPETVCRVVARALRRPREERFDTAADLAQALERARREIGPATAPGAGDDEVATRALAAGEGPSAEPPTNLPPRGSALIGRDRELAELVDTLRSGGARLVTLTGPGGTGKTRLAVEAARVVLADFSDGAFAADLSTLSDPSGIAAHVAGVFRLKESPERSLVEQLERHLASKRLLLVLDNFEHLLAGAPVISRLLAAAPGLTVVATSRAPLHLSQEREFAVEPLEVPAFTSLPPLEELARTPAVALFVERAREAKSSFALTAENARAVVEICRRLDGLPLALELAAARVKLLSPPAMMSRLDHRLKLLTGGARDLPDRQQTMRGAVAWSYELLEEAEKAVLRRMAVFVGGCSLEAAEAVCGERVPGWRGPGQGGDGGSLSAQGIPPQRAPDAGISDWPPEIDVLDALGSLVDKSLLRQREQDDGEVRFTMLEVVNEFALEQLEASGEGMAVRLAHGRYFLGLAEEAEPKLKGTEPAPWLERLSREQENLRAALALLLKEDGAAGARLAAAMGGFWLSRSLYTEGRGWLMRALSAGSDDPVVRSNLLRVLSNAERTLGDREAAAEHAGEAVEAARAAGDRELLAVAINTLGIVFQDRGESARAREAWEEGLVIARELGSVLPIAQFLNNLGEAVREEGDYRAARSYYEQALDAIGRHKRNPGTAISLQNLGGVSIEEGDLSAAGACYREALAILSEMGDAFFGACALDGTAAVALGAGKPELAARLAGASEAIYEAVGAPLDPWEKSLRDRYVARLREALEPAALEREWARGRAMTFQEAAAEALGG